MANHLEGGAEAGPAGNINGRHSGVGARSRRDSSHPVHGSGIFPSQFTQLTAGPNHGTAISYFRHLDPGTGDAHPDPVWDGAGAVDICPRDEFNRNGHPFEGTRKTAMVKPWNS